MTPALDGVRIFNPAGEPIGHIALPERCANLCFGGRWQAIACSWRQATPLYLLYVNDARRAGRLTARQRRPEEFLPAIQCESIPRPCGREALAAVLAALDEALRAARAAGASGAVRTVHARQLARCVRASLVRRMGEAPVGRHGGTVRRGQERPRRVASALRTFGRQVTLGHRPHRRERAASAAFVVVDWHRLPLAAVALRRLATRRRRRAASAPMRSFTCQATSECRHRR